MSRTAGIRGRPQCKEGRTPLLGAHMSIAGGLHHAIEQAATHRCTAVQFFSKSSNQWAARPLTPQDLDRWNAALAQSPMATVAHDSYLINLASPDPDLLRKSREAFLEEVRRCDLLGIPFLVFHPGAHMGAGEDEGLAAVARSLDWVCERSEGSRVLLLLETTAGQGTSLGYRFEQLAAILERSRASRRLGVCLDTCHVFAAGYDIRTEGGYASVIREFDRRVGLPLLRCLHVNDSKRELGSRVDRHEHIGKGRIGSRAFGFLMRDERFAEIPKILETPKEGAMDRRNLAILRRLASSGARDARLT